MGITERLGLVYPSDGQSDHFTILETLFTNLDLWMYGALRIFGLVPCFGSEELTLSDGTLTWSNDLYFDDPYTGNRKKIVAGNLSVDNYDFVYFDIESEIQAIETVTLAADQQVDVAHNRVILGQRIGSYMYWVFRNIPNTLLIRRRWLVASLTLTNGVAKTFASLTDIYGNGLPSTITNPKILVANLRTNEIVSFSAISNTGFTPVLSSGGAATAIMDLYIIEPNV